MKKINDFKKLDFLKQNFKKEEFSDVQIDLLTCYCKDMTYKIRVSEERNVIKVSNPKNRRFGYIKKIKDKIFYGYYSNKEFISKYPLKSNINSYLLFKKVKQEANHNNLIKAFCGIIDLDYKL